MIKEAILYVNQIIEMISAENKEKKIEEDLKLSNIEMEKNLEIENFAVPEPLIQTGTQSRSRTRRNNKSANCSQAAVRSQSTRIRKSTQTQTQVDNEQSQRPRTQSAKRIRKNEKGETPLHLAVMNVKK